MAGKGLYANIRAKKQRIKQGSGEKMKKPGSKGAPTKENFNRAAQTASFSEGGIVLKKNIDGIAMRGRTRAGMCA
jgi:hypothetical protein